MPNLLNPLFIYFNTNSGFPGGTYTGKAGMIEITDGIKAGDTICTTGMLFLRPDAVLNFSTVG